MHKHSIAPKTMVSLTLALLGLMNWTSILSQAAHTMGSARGSSAASSLDATEADRGNTLAVPESRLHAADSATRSRVAETYARRPLRFESNQGQTDPSVKFLARNEDYDLFLTSTETVFLLNGPPAKISRASKKNGGVTKLRRAALRIRLEGANPAAEIEGLDEQPGKSNYIIGRDAGSWRTDIAGYGKVQYRSVYPGVDLIYYGKGQSIESDFVVAPGADYRNIKLAIQGATKIRIDSHGDLVLTTPVGEVRQHKPYVYQEVDGGRRAVTAGYVMTGKRQVSFRVGAHDAGRPLVIDPVLDYSTFLGGSNTDEGRSIAVDASGNAYIAGRTASFNFPVTISAFDTTYANSFDVFVTKLNAAGSDLVYSTFLGGNSDDTAFGIVVDSTGNAYVTGSTGSNNYPTTPGVFQPTVRGNTDGFVTRLNSTGTALLYSTYLGGTSSDQASSIAIDISGNAYVTGITMSTNFPTTPGAFQTTYAGGSFEGDAFITKLNSTGTAPVYSTFLGGVRADQGTGIVVDSLGRAFISGSTNSTDFDVTGGAFQTIFGGSTSQFNSNGDAFVTEMNDTGTALVYSTYIGGLSDEAGLGIALNSSGEAFVTGSTSSSNFPVTPGVVRVENGGAAKTTNAAATWAAINAGLTDNTILSFAIHPTTPAIVYAGTGSAGVFKSTDGGVNWSLSSSGLTSLTIRTLAIDHTTPSILYLGTSSRGVFRSTDSGDTWRGINTGQDGSNVNSLVVDPSNTSIIYAGTDQGVFKTTNGGANWDEAATALSNSFIHVLAIDPVNTSNLYAGTFNGVYTSTNGGQTWSPSSLTNALSRALTIDPLTPSNVYAGTDRGAFKSTDQGATWRGINIGLFDRTINAVAINPASPSVVYIGTRNGVFKSIDGGGLWSPASTGLAGSVINTLAVDPAVPATVYAGGEAGQQDAFAIRLNAAGSALLYSTYIGGSSFDSGASIAIDASDNAYVTGLTNSTNFPTTPGTFRTTSGFSTDSFVTKLNPAGTGFVYSTYLGGFDSDQGLGIAVNSSGNAFVTGGTSSSNFPTTPGAFQTTLTGFSQDAFVTKLSQVPNLTADLNVTLTGPSGTLMSGQSVTYTITVTNNGPDPAISVFVTDELSPLTGSAGCNSDMGSSCNTIGKTVTFSIVSLAPGATLHASVFTIVNCAGPPSGTVVNTVTAESLTPDSNAANNSRSVSNAATLQPLFLSSSSQSFTASGGSGGFQVLGPSCSWSAVSNVPWVTISFFSGCCNGFVNYDVAANSGPARTGTMTIGGETFTVNQAGIPCTYSLLPTSNSFTAAGGIASFDVTTQPGCNWTPFPNDSWITINSGSGPGNGTVSYTVAVNPTASPRSSTIVVQGQVHTVDQAASTTTAGTDTIGLYNPAGGTFFLRNSNSTGVGDVSFAYGPGGAGLIPLVGDWNNDGVDTIGLYNPTTSTFFLRNANSTGVADLAFAYGPAGAGWTPIAGDWNGDGTDTIGLYNPATGTFFLRNSNTTGVADVSFAYGPGGLGWKPLAGDWNGDGTDSIGLYNPAAGTFFLRNTNSTGIADVSFAYGPGGQGWLPLAGDWNNDGVDTIGLYNPSASTFFLRNSNSTGIADLAFAYGPAGLGWTPLIGDWDGL